jgi:transposase
VVHRGLHGAKILPNFAPMYIKVQTRTKVGTDGKKHSSVYPRLYESYRDCDGKIRQHYLIPLDLDDLPSWKDRYAMCHVLNDMVANGPSLPFNETPVTCKAREVYGQLAEKGLLGDAKKVEERNRRQQAAALVEESLKNVRPRQAGAEFVCLEALKRLKLRSFLASKGWSKSKIDLAMIQIAARAIYPFSEHKTVNYLRDNSALCEFFGIEPKEITKDKLYRSALDLYSLHDGIEDYLHDRVCSIFDLEDTVYLFDLSNAYMESTKLSELRQFGRSKEKRSDCPIVVLGAVVNKDGFLVRTMIFSGNTADCATMQDIMKSLNPPSSDGKKKIVVMDAGISIEDNLKWLRENDYDYITVRRGGSTDDYKIIGDHTVTVEDVKHQSIEIQFAEIENLNDTLLLVDSHAKTLKEKSMHEKAATRFEDGLKAIKKGITTKGGTKKRDKVNERLGRLKERCSSVQKDYDITFTYDDKDTVTDMTWTRNPEKASLRSSGEGTYLVQTSLKGYSEQQIWEFYNVIRRVEAVFETLKTDLDIRPVYHQSDEAIKAHFNLAVLAYWVVSTTQYQLRRKGCKISWHEVKRIADTQVVVSTIAKRVDGNEVEVRQCTEPEQQLSDLYKKLELTSPPLKRRRKICVVHFSEVKKIDT